MLIFLIFILFTSTAQAEEPKIYNWKVLRTLDGDSLEIANEFLPQELKLFVRIKGIDTPEKAPRAKCEKENALGQKATIFTKKAIENAQKNNQKITFTEIKWDKYGGRIVAKVFINNIDLAQELIKNGLGRVYFGDKKKSWCD
jgi:endonuclease YncB( thermonuclease family)